MFRAIILVEELEDWPATFPAVELVRARDYLSSSALQETRALRVINLCRGYHYLTLGYYCSLLGEARRHRLLPSVRTLADLDRKNLYELVTRELNQEMLRPAMESATAEELSFNIYFGKSERPGFTWLARALYEAFPAPILRVNLHLGEKSEVRAIEPGALHELDGAQQRLFLAALEALLNRGWRRPRARRHFRYDMAILHDPTEKLAPSNPRALARMIRAGRRLGINVELVTRRDYDRLAEYDALFIRETTHIDHHTYQFARKAEREGMVVLDDSDSIVRCTNKVYLAELIDAHELAAPTTVIINRDEIDRVEQQLDYPLVLKIPDGSFSRGVHKVQHRSELHQVAAQLFASSDLILAQAFVYTEFDWRIGVLNRKPLFACQYFMSKHHWQIVKHEGEGRFKVGNHRAVPVAEVPEAVIQLALKAANLIGNGLYGVDIKQSGNRLYLIEINDNPNLDAGVEDQILGMALYQQLMQEFLRRLQLRRTGRP